MPIGKGIPKKKPKMPNKIVAISILRGKAAPMVADKIGDKTNVYKMSIEATRMGNAIRILGVFRRPDE